MNYKINKLGILINNSDDDDDDDVAYFFSWGSCFSYRYDKEYKNLYFTVPPEEDPIVVFHDITKQEYFIFIKDMEDFLNEI